MRLHKEWVNLLGRTGTRLVLILIPVILSSCRNDEGEGGTGSISGTLIEHNFNDDYSSLIFQDPSVDEEVFILYGDNKVLGDRTFTSNTGEFRFNYLFPGSYQIYYMSEDSTSLLAEEKEELIQVELERGEELDLGNLVQLRTLDYDDGAATIKGVVKVIQYVEESRWPNLVIEDEYFAMEQEVYIKYGNHEFYDDRIRTQFDGYFEFNELIPGDYLVFLYSDDVTRLTETVVLKFELSITEMDQVIDLGEITIEKI